MNRIFNIIKLLSLVGVVLAVYLLWQRFYHPAFQPCRVNSTVNCDAITTGAVSNTLGIPTPLIGLVGYITIYVAASLKMKKLVLGMATFGLLFCLWIGFREIFELHVICPVCIGCQVVMISVFLLGLCLFRSKKVSEKKN